MRPITLAPLAITAVLILAAPQLAAAHDFWLEPSSFAPAVNSAVRVHFRVGDHFSGERLERNDARIRRFVAIAPDGTERPLVGRHGMDPAGIVRVDAPGIWTLVYRGTPSSLTLAAQAFEGYLKEEGLEHISQARATRGESRRPGREHFSRAVKSLIAVGSSDPGSVAGYDRAAGLTLEIVPEANPFAAGRSELPVRLIYEGAPLAGALIVAMRKATPDAKAEIVSAVRTDAQGRAVVGSGPGLWLIKAVHMVAAPGTKEIDWESTWTSMTFEVGSQQ
jgi:uncharacterized GH25 family protein